MDPADQPQALQALYRLFVLNCALRNGDAHLKNFALIYDRVDGPLRFAPVYDLVTTKAYLPNDAMALTLDGSTRWPDAKRLTQLGQLRAGLSPSSIGRIFEETADAMADAWKEAARYFPQCSEPGVGERMKSAWEEGIAEALGRGSALTLRASPSREPKPLARSQAALLKLLRTEGGAVLGTVSSIAAKLSLPPGTLSGALKALQDRGLIVREGRSIRLADREV